MSEDVDEIGPGDYIDISARLANVLRISARGGKAFYTHVMGPFGEALGIGTPVAHLERETRQLLRWLLKDCEELTELDMDSPAFIRAAGALAKETAEAFDCEQTLCLLEQLGEHNFSPRLAVATVTDLREAICFQLEVVLRSRIKAMLDEWAQRGWSDEEPGQRRVVVASTSRAVR